MKTRTLCTRTLNMITRLFAGCLESLATCAETAPVVNVRCKYFIIYGIEHNARGRSPGKPYYARAAIQLIKTIKLKYIILLKLHNRIEKIKEKQNCNRIFSFFTLSCNNSNP